MTWQKVARGQRFKVPTAINYNDLADSVNDWLDRKRSKGASENPMSAEAPTSELVYNATGAALPRFSVIAITGSRVNPNEAPTRFQQRVAYTGTVPTAATGDGWGVTLMPIAAGALGRVCTAGVVMCRVTDNSQGGVPHAEVVPGVTTHLRLSSLGGADVLYRPGGPGVEWSLIRLGQMPILFPVLLTNDGGDQAWDEYDEEGALIAQHPATWTYEVSTITGELLAEDVDPVVAPHHFIRPPWGDTGQANFGIARYNDTGNLELCEINETWMPSSTLGDLDAIRNRLDLLEDAQWSDRIDELEYQHRTDDIGFMERNTKALVSARGLPDTWPPGQAWANIAGVLSAAQLLTRMTWLEDRLNAVWVSLVHPSITWHPTEPIDTRIEEAMPYVFTACEEISLTMKP